MTLPKTRRLARAALASACIVAVGLVAAQPSAAKTKTRTYSCGDVPVSKTPAGLKGGYLTNIRVTGRYTRKSSACRSGRSLALNYYKCRARKGIRSTCNGRTINGLRCTERRPSALQTQDQINATVTCRKGSKRIIHSYQQNLTG